MTAGVLVAVIATGGCGFEAHLPSPATEPLPRWPVFKADLSFVWSAEPGIELLSGPAVIVRAYFESTMNASSAGSNDYLYPGFDHAVPADENAAEPGSINLWPEIGFPTTAPWVGVTRDHLLRITDRGSTIHAVNCHWTWGAAKLQPSGRYVNGPWEPDRDAGVSVMRFTLVPPPSGENTTLPPQEGPSKFPVDDVFGDWKVIGKLNQSTPPATLDREWPEYRQDLEACITKAPESGERRIFLTTGEHPRSDFPTLPPYPGWPVENN
ncbi:hypothetical protein BH11ACT7_BH11ACT7_27940 [soil metagenome]